MTTPTNTCYIITIEACEDVDAYVFPEKRGTCIYLLDFVLKEREIEKSEESTLTPFFSPTRIMIRCGCVTNCAHAIHQN